MNKKLLVGAIAMAITGLAQAQSNVTLYGIADAALQIAKTPNGNVSRVISGGASGSRWGLKGSEDLGDGLKANFDLQSGINVDDGSSGQGGLLFGRRATIGLSGGFGAVDLGRRDTPLFDVLAAVEPSGNGNNFGMNDMLTNATRGYARRINNQIRYETPNLSGFKGAVMYGLGEANTVNGTDKSLNNVLGIGLTYSNGPLYLGYAYQNTEEGSTLVSGVTTAVTSHKYNTLGASYDFTAVKLFGMYYTDKRDLTALTSKIDQRVYAIGASVPFGASSVALQYGKIKDKVSRITGAADAREVALTYQYSLSKRTTLYASYSDYRNDNYTTALGGFTAFSDKFFDTTSSSTASNRVTAKSSALMTGIRHSF